MLKPKEHQSLTPFDQCVFDQVVRPDHYLRQVQRAVDFERFRPRLAEAYSPDHGRPGLDPVLMLKILFLRFHYQLSDRQVMARIQTDMAFRWFLELGLGEAVPDHTSDTYFRQRIGAERFAQIFQELVTQAREHGLVRDRLRLKDATHVLAAAADLTPLALAAQVRDRLLAAAEPFFADWVAEERQRLLAVRQTTAELPDADRLASRIEYLREILGQVRDRVARLGPETSTNRQRLDKVLALADKFLIDRQPGADDRLINTVDAEARVGVHGGYFLGYLLDVAVDADSELITAVQVLPANGAEAAAAAPLIDQEESAQGNDVAGLSMDGAGYHGAVLRELSDPAGRNLEVTVPVPKAAPTPTYGPERFTLTVIDEATSELTCPNGQTTRQREVHAHGYRYHFTTKQCAGCGLRSECLRKPASRKGRSVIKNEYESEYRRVAAQAATPAYEAVRREHPKVERKLGELVRHHGNRRARFRGLGKVLVQSCLTALVVNVKRMVKLLAGAAESARESVRESLLGPEPAVVMAPVRAEC